MAAKGKKDEAISSHPPVLPSPSDLDPASVEARSPSVDMAEMVAAQRALVSRLAADPNTSVSERLAHERTLTLLVDQLKHTTQTRDPEDAYPSLRAAVELTDLFTFDLPRSHRQSAPGRFISASKRAFLGGLKPLHIETLRPQQSFDLALIRALRDVIAQRQGVTLADLPRLVREDLSQLTNPARWQVNSHREGLSGQAAGSIKRLYLDATRPLLGDVFARQRRWNEVALEATALAAQWDPSIDAARALLAELTTLADPFVELGASRAARLLQPFWREVFRRQQRFNEQIVILLSQLFGLVTPSRRVDYQAWCAAREPEDIRNAARAVERLTDGPLLSIVTPVYDTPAELLRACVESVRAQSYVRWELLLVDDGSPAPHVRPLLEELAVNDARIRVLPLGKNVGIALATNAGLQKAKGDFVAFLDHDDTLAPHALAEVVLALRANPKLDVLYCDEDKLDPRGGRTDPFFKPDWSPDLLRAVNYVCHFLVVRRSLAASVGFLREGFDGSQDFDFILRLSERTSQLGHIPKILYHWRMAPQSTALNIAAKPQATDAGIRAVREHLARMGEKGEVESPLPTNYRIKYPLQGSPKVSFIVPHKDKVHLTRAMVESLLAHTSYPNWELLLISNNSVQPETFTFLDSLDDPRIKKLTWDHPFNWSAINNFGAAQATGELLLLANNDLVFIQDDWLEELVGHALRPEVGAVGPKLLFPNRTIQEAGVVVGMGGMAGHTFVGLPANSWTPFGHSHWTRNYLAVTGACVLVRRQSFEAISGLDERFIVCGSDVDLCLRLTARGLRTIYTPHATVIHDESSTRKLDRIPQQDYYESFRAYGPYLKHGDPYYNPNLSLSAGDGALRTDWRSAEELAALVLGQTTEGAPRGYAPNPRLRHQRDVTGFLGGLDYSASTMARSRLESASRLAAVRSKKLKRLTWLIPGFKHPYGGIHTILRFGQLMRDRHGVQSHYVIFDSPDGRASDFEARTKVLFAEPPGTFEVLRRHEDMAQLPECDLSIATFWMSAYLVLKHERATAHGYFVQDFEPLFYPAGTLYALAEQSYRLGLYGIFNTPGLHDYVTRAYDMQGCWFEPAVDQHIFHAQRPERSGPVRVFFYGRPAADRNAFELGLASLRKLKELLGDKVQILSAGESWDPSTFGVRGVVENLGVLPYAQTAELYRTCDVGLVFMFTKHPSYLPFELMASGVTVVTNYNTANTWLLEHEENCLLTEPTVSAVVEQLVRAAKDAKLRARVGEAASTRVIATTWEEQIDRVHLELSADAPGRGTPPLQLVQP